MGGALTKRGKQAHGGQRQGAGRKPNQEPTQWLQVMIRTTEEEWALIRGLTPVQRRDKFLSASPGISKAKGRGSTDNRVHHVVRVELREGADKAEILALSTDERRERLLEGLLS